MKHLRSEWFEKINLALAILKKNTHPIAKLTRELVMGKMFNGKKIKLMPFQKIIKKDIPAISSMAGINFKRNTIHPKSIKILQEDYDGFCCGSKIYINESCSADEIATTLVHELNHFVNNTPKNYDSPEKIFKEELRAHLAEELVFTKKPLTRQSVKKISALVSELHEVPLPAKITLPDGFFY